jgi:hypothetical protein
MKRLRTLLVPTLSCALVLGCGSPTNAEKDADLAERQADLVSGDWVSKETYTGSGGTTLNLRVSIYPVAAPSVLLGTWRLGIRTGRIDDGDLTENDISLLLTVVGLSSLSLTGTVSSDAIVGTLTGDVVKILGGERWDFSGTAFTLRRGF